LRSGESHFDWKSYPVKVKGISEGYVSTPVFNVLKRCSLDAACGLRVYALEPNQPLRLTVRKRAQQNAVDEAEHGCVEANSESQRQDDHHCKARSAQQCAQGITNILNQRVHRGDSMILQ
jgi:hypothetical protein